MQGVFLYSVKYDVILYIKQRSKYNKFQAAYPNGIAKSLKVIVCEKSVQPSYCNPCSQLFIPKFTIRNCFTTILSIRTWLPEV